jgi:hypothetical protein
VVVFFAIFETNLTNMKKTILTIIIIAAAAACAYAQPRSMGARLGTTGLEAAYQHEMARDQFIEGNLGLDFGVLAEGHPGLKATAVYNFVWARPAWTYQGTWALYAGPGASLGYVHDDVHFKLGDQLVHYNQGGFMLGICGQVGLEYTFWFPLQLSIDLRPTVGMHISGRHKEYDSRVGLYDTGLMGFLPTLSVRYRF